MDYYHVLRVAPNASRKEIEQAYQRLIKESRYDTSIDKHLIENAYRTLSDLKSKTVYDARQNLRQQRVIRKQKFKPKLPRIGVIEWIKQRTRKQLLITLAILICLTTVFYVFRFGYLLQQFQAGDVLYDNISHLEFGKILRVENDHDFGSNKRKDAYQVEVHPASRRSGGKSALILWLPQESVKARCYKKKPK